MAFFGRRDIVEAFRSNRQLQQFFLTGVTSTGTVLGTGSFGAVEEVVYKHRVCAAKKLHETLIDVGNEGVGEVVRKYLQECQLMSSLRHPNITQFLGLCFFQEVQLPLLVMERLDTSLDDLLEHMPNLPLSLKRSMLEDVACGLLYLHEMQPPVIHRDLTSKNVLLTSSLVAKITDMGNSRIVDIRPGQVARTLSAFPGTLVYMPPEAQDDRHRYGPSLDIFSFGHLALYTITQQFPGDLLPSTFTNPDNVEEVRARNEVERRGRYIEMLEHQINSLHPGLVELVKQCLHNAPHKRPSTEQLLTRLREMRVQVEGEYGRNVIKLDFEKVILAKEVKMKDRILQQQMQQIRQLQEQRQVKDQEIAAKDNLCEGKNIEISRLSDALRSLQTRYQQELTWRCGSDLPFSLSNSVQSAVVQGTLYVGSGCHNNPIYKRTIMKYDISSGKWTTLPPYRARGFAMTAARNQLVLVGGIDVDSCEKVRSVGVWRADWTCPYPDMPTARSKCTAAAHEEFLIVVGGVDGGSLSSVEVLNTDTKQWHAAPCLPAPQDSMKVAIVRDTLYCVCGFRNYVHSDKMFSVSLPTLLRHINASDENQVWSETELKQTCSAPLSANLLVAFVATSRTRELLKIGDLPTSRFQCTCAMISDSEFAVVGGWDGEREIKSMDICGIFRVEYIHD